MIKNIVTIFLSIFIIAVIGILGASVLTNQKSTVDSNTQQQSPVVTETNVNPTNFTDNDSDENESDDNDDDAYTSVKNTTNTTSNNQTTNTTTTNTSGITSAQFAKHNTASDCWIKINGNAYNMTNYLKAHPGGASAITPYCGKGDATAAFDTKGGQGSHSPKAESLLTNYFLGKIIN